MASNAGPATPRLTADCETALTKLKKNRAKAEKLFGKTNGCGMIIGEIVTGDVATYEGLLGIPVLEFRLWPESEWIKSPGGLGMRHMPEKMQEARISSQFATRN